MRDIDNVGWAKMPLGEVVTLHYGKALPKEQRNPNGAIPVYGANGVKDASDQHHAEGPTLIIGRKGSAGELTRVDGPFWPLDVTYYTSHDDSRLDFDFLHYVLGDLDLPKLARGVKPGINRNDVYSLPILLPPLEEQRRIVAMLDKAFEGLDRAHAHAEANLQNAREMFESASGSIVLGRSLERRGDDQEGEPNALKAEKARRATDRKFREPLLTATIEWPSLPVGWQWASPEQLCSHIVDCLHATPKWTEQGEICLRTTNFRPGELDLTKVRYVSPGTYAQRIARLEPLPGDVLYSREGGILGIACVHPEGLRACLGQRMMQFRLRREFMIAYSGASGR